MMFSSTSSRLTALTSFGTNPGALSADIYIPKNFSSNGPLVVVLHGSTQSAESYDYGSGWSALADKYGFALLFPGQRLANNLIGSFNWFRSGDSRRGAGESLSIRQMIKQVVEDCAIDTSRIFITGLSSGGAMAAVMLATYPEVFAGGAIIAGLPYQITDTLLEAFFRMRGYTGSLSDTLEVPVRQASKFTGPWPTISVWHGSDDKIVDHSSASSIVRQWQRLHKVEGPPTRVEKVDGFPRRVWCDSDGREVIEEYIIEGMGHGTPISAEGETGLGKEGRFMLDVGISSTLHIAKFWGLAQ